MINMGAMMVVSLIKGSSEIGFECLLKSGNFTPFPAGGKVFNSFSSKEQPDMPAADRFDFIRNVMQEFCAGRHVFCDMV